MYRMSSGELAATPKELAMLAHSITAYLAFLQKQPRSKRERALSVTLTDIRENIQRALKNGGRLSLSPDELHAVHVALAGLMGEMVLLFSGIGGAGGNDAARGTLRTRSGRRTIEGEE